MSKVKLQSAGDFDSPADYYFKKIKKIGTSGQSIRINKRIQLGRSFIDVIFQ